MSALKGSIALIPTPLKENGSLDEVGLRKLIDYDMEYGCYGVGVLAAIGEGYLFSEETARTITSVAVDHLNGRGPLIVGCPAMGTTEAVEKCKKAEDLGADAILAFNPKYKGLSPYRVHELIDHYMKLVESVSIHVVPYSQSDDMIPFEVIKCLVDEEKISYMKNGWHDFGVLKQLVHALGDRLFIFVGADTHTLRHLILGAKGISTATAAVFPEENALLLSMVQKGDLDTARKYYHDKIVPWNDCGFYSNWQAVHKLALQRMGIIESACCMPPLSLPAEHQVEEVTWLLKHLGKI
jgi:4-hydroxy-tetrahydrodipicolinate synthase